MFCFIGRTSNRSGEQKEQTHFFFFEESNLEAKFISLLKLPNRVTSLKKKSSLAFFPPSCPPPPPPPSTQFTVPPRENYCYLLLLYYKTLQEMREVLRRGHQQAFACWRDPTNNNFRLSLQCRNFVNKQQLSIQIGAERAKTCMQCVQNISTELLFCLPSLVVGWEEEAGGGE